MIKSFNLIKSDLKIRNLNRSVLTWLLEVGGNRLPLLQIEIKRLCPYSLLRANVVSLTDIFLGGTVRCCICRINIFITGLFNPFFPGNLQMRATHLGCRPPSFMGPFHELCSLRRGAECGGVLKRWLVFLSHH